jgi:lipopolysaccharide transport system ATP-binding protein
MVLANIKLINVDLYYPLLDYSKQSIKLSAFKFLNGGRINFESNSPYVLALKNINLEIKHGEKIGLYGPNGSGKTTLLRTLAGIYHPEKGIVEINGDITSMLSLNLGVDIFQTGVENIKLKGKFLKLTDNQIEDMINYISNFSELGEFLNLPLSTYSSGMLLRFQFSLATFKTSEIILLDEWLSAGDENFAPKAEKKMEEMIKNVGILVIASHNISLLKRICNKIIYLERGEIKKIENTKL